MTFIGVLLYSLIPTVIIGSVLMTMRDPEWLDRIFEKLAVSILEHLHRNKES